MKRKRKQFGVNWGGKMIIVIAYSKKQIGEELGLSQDELTNYCSEAQWRDNRIIDADLTTKEKG